MSTDKICQTSVTPAQTYTMPMMLLLIWRTWHFLENRRVRCCTVAHRIENRSIMAQGTVGLEGSHNFRKKKKTRFIFTVNIIVLRRRGSFRIYSYPIGRLYRIWPPPLKRYYCTRVNVKRLLFLAAGSGRAEY